MDAWTNSEKVPQTTKEISELIIKALKEHPKDEVEELLRFYDLPLQHAIYADDKTFESLLKGVKLELHTLPVDEREVADGDSISVYVRASHVLETILRSKQAQALRNYAKADALDQEIINSGHWGIDAPEGQMPNGKEATNELIKIIQGKSLKIHVYHIDCYRRLVGDIYCDGIFVQELLLKKGCAWHYPQCDKREELRNWEIQAKTKQVGLWAFSALRSHGNGEGMRCHPD